MSNVATVFGVMGKSLGLLPDAVAARASLNVIKNQNQFKIGAAGSQFQTASRHQAIARPSAKRWMNFWRITDEAPAPTAPEAQATKTCCTRGAATANVHASSLIRCCGNVDKRCKFAAQSKGAGLRRRVCSRICVPHNQYLSVHVAAPARSRQVANAPIAASVLSMIQPSGADHCAIIGLGFE